MSESFKAQPGVGMLQTDRIPSYTLTYIAKSPGAEDLVVTEGGYSYADASVIVRSLLTTGFCESVLVEAD